MTTLLLGEEQPVALLLALWQKPVPLSFLSNGADLEQSTLSLLAFLVEVISIFALSEICQLFVWSAFSGLAIGDTGASQLVETTQVNLTFHFHKFRVFEMFSDFATVVRV